MQGKFGLHFCGKPGKPGSNRSWWLPHLGRYGFQFLHDLATNGAKQEISRAFMALPVSSSSNMAYFALALVMT
jgi:hypothetical protein